MKEKTALLLALVVSILAVVGLQRHLDRREREILDEDQVAVVAAARELPKGTVLSNADLGVRRIPKRFRPPSVIEESDAPHASGKVLLNARRQGEPLLWLDLPEPGHRLAARVPSGERAVCLPVDDTSGFAGLLAPGDRVDVIGIFDEDGAGGARAARTLLTNMTVLAVGSSIGPDTDVEAAAVGYSSVTLSATPSEAQLLALARHAARLTLALRNPRDVEPKPAPEVRESHLRDPDALRGWAERHAPPIEILRKGAESR